MILDDILNILHADVNVLNTFFIKIIRLIKHVNCLWFWYKQELRIYRIWASIYIYTGSINLTIITRKLVASQIKVPL